MVFSLIKSFTFHDIWKSHCFLNFNCQILYTEQTALLSHPTKAVELYQPRRQNWKSQGNCCVSKSSLKSQLLVGDKISSFAGRKKFGVFYWIQSIVNIWYISITCNILRGSSWIWWQECLKMRQVIIMGTDDHLAFVKMLNYFLLSCHLMLRLPTLDIHS